MEPVFSWGVGGRSAELQELCTVGRRVAATRADDLSLRPAARPYFSNRDSTRSASGLPPVWQVGQYWNVESA